MSPSTELQDAAREPQADSRFLIVAALALAGTLLFSVQFACSTTCATCWA
jgi:hypothetical protein